MANVLLLATVGGSPEALVSGILSAKPARVIFVCSAATRKSITSADESRPGIVERLASENCPLDTGRYDVLEIPDPQDLTSAVEHIHREATASVERWLSRGAGFLVVADFTGGTKCMSMALGLVARSWTCRLQYVGGRERTKEGAGAVVPGTEQIVQFRNDPWEVLGFKLIDEAATMFDQGDAAAAAAWIERGRNSAAEGPLKSALTALHYFLDLYACWDRFDHDAALRNARAFAKHAYLLAPLFSNARIAKLRDCAAESAAFLHSLGPADAASREFVLDLAANARRRLGQERYDDALARVYRAMEALAQWKLAASHGIVSTGRVPVAAVPEPLRGRWTHAAREGLLKLGIQDAYELLSALDDPLGARFEALGLAGQAGSTERGKGSPLNARNSSILAHGFRPARPAETQELWNKLLLLLETTEAALPQFPKLQARAEFSAPSRG